MTLRLPWRGFDSPSRLRLGGGIVASGRSVPGDAEGWPPLTYTEPVTRDEILGSHVAKARLARRHPLRPDAPLTQSLLAEFMADVGVPWIQSTVALIETGRRRISVVELMALSAVLQTPMADLLGPGNEPTVDVGESRWPAAYWRRVAAGDVGALDELPVGEAPALPPGRQPALSDEQRAPDAVVDRWGLDPDALTVTQLRNITLGRDADAAAPRVRRMLRGQKGASTVQSADVAAVAWKLWGHSYSEEYEQRSATRTANDMSPRSIQALRGHVTREMHAEIAGHVTRWLAGEIPMAMECPGPGRSGCARRPSQRAECPVPGATLPVSSP